MQFISLAILAIFPIIFHLFVISNASPLLSEKLGMDRQFEFTFQNMKKAYRMPVPRDDPCPEGTKLLVTVLSRRNGIEKRNAIRATWAADRVPNQVIRFVIGQSASKNGTNFEEELEPEIESSLRREQSKFGDLIFYGMPDGYYNLPLKLMAIFQWQQTFCASAKFLLKIDDDLVVDLDRLDFWIKNRYEPILKEFPLAIFGQMIVYWEKGGIAHHSTVVRKKSEKWYMSPADYSPNLYPPYLNGPSYLMSTAAVGAILKRTGQVPFLPFEDLLFTGILGQKANISLFGYESTFQIICHKKMPCNSSHSIGDTFYPKLESETAPNGTIQFRPEPADEGIQLQIAQKGQRHCEPLDCDQPEVNEQRLKAILNEPGDGLKEEECEIELNGNCAKRMPRVAIWCRSGMEKLEEYQRFYAKLRALKCE